MRIVIAPDKFKDCLSAAQVAQAAAAGVNDAQASAQIDQCPMSDGGEGFVDAMVQATGGTLHTRCVTGPLPDMQIEATFGLLGDGQTAVIEMSAASGLHLLKPGERNPLHTTTYGTGELLLAAADMGASRILLGIGGSATNDGGLGAAQACGLPILLRDGQTISPTDPLTGSDLQRVMYIKRGRGGRLDRIPITVACDVTNPLTGSHGASMVYGPQKGADPEQIQQFDQWLHGLAERTGTLEQATTAGAGAAGGLGWGLMAFFNASLQRGVDIVLRATNFAQRLQGAHLCITGEGRLDHTSLHGKVVGAVATQCQLHGVPVLIIAGDVAEDVQLPGIQAMSLRARAGSIAAAIAQAPELIRQCAAQAMRAGMAEH